MNKVRWPVSRTGSRWRDYFFPGGGVENLIYTQVLTAVTRRITTVWAATDSVRGGKNA